jgi:hypothetical protein
LEEGEHKLEEQRAALVAAEDAKRKRIQLLRNVTESSGFWQSGGGGWIRLSVTGTPGDNTSKEKVYLWQRFTFFDLHSMPIVLTSF